MSTRRCACLAAVLFLLPLPLCAAETPVPPAPAVEGSAPAKPDEKTQLLAYRFHEGDAYTYRFLLEGKGTMVPAGGGGLSLPVSVKTEITIQQKVARVRPDGSAEVEALLTFKRIQLNEMDLPGTLPTPRHVTLVMLPSGRVLEVREDPGSGGGKQLPGVDAANLASLTQSLVFPERAVKIGESWSSEPAPGTDYRTTTTLIGLDAGSGHPVARLKQAFTMPIRTKAPNPLAGGMMSVAGKQAADLTLRFDLDGGHLAEAGGTLDSAVTLSTPEGPTMQLRLKTRVHLDPLPAAAPEKGK